jgi:hypothetical protein
MSYLNKNNDHVFQNNNIIECKISNQLVAYLYVRNQSEISQKSVINQSEISQKSVRNQSEISQKSVRNQSSLKLNFNIKITKKETKWMKTKLTNLLIL